MRQTIIGLFFLNIFTIFSYAQNSTLEGYVFEDGNRGFLNAVTVKITQKETNKFIANATTNEEGVFTAILPVGKTYLLEAQKDLFLPQQATVQVKSKDKNKKVYAKIKMFRKPGYIFEVTLAERMQAGQKQVDAITGRIIILLKG